MRQSYIFTLLAAAALVFTVLQTAHAGIRCRNDIISTGENKLEVTIKLRACGEILDKTSYVKEKTHKLGSDKTSSDVLVEQWHVRIRERGGYYCYPLVFEDGVLKSIGKWTRCN